ncbi:ABC transporter permease [Paracoccus pantotrophus]|uniref:ABC transporter permease n=1 Tax=Paracoccus pantotrophus TaxID=82367 RepID=UPI000E095B91|nr:ABC transporter permease [Paracoccus pantotrophus]RDD95284.1 ABC transporter permease [Paracoccus pantotrophus]WGR64176.1 ABC transporter permease [Paracoccus pantotrophus]
MTDRKTSFLRRFLRHKMAVAGLALLFIILIMAASASIFYPQGPWKLAGRPLLWPAENPRFPLGTDVLGRDLLAALLYGAQVSLFIGLAATLVATILGTFIGSVAGYFGGVVDRAMMGFTEIFQTIPPFVLAVVVVAAFKPTLGTIVVAISLVSWPPLARLVRAQFLQLKNAEFIQAATLLGMSDTRIILTQLLPNAVTPIVVSGSLMIASAILLEAGLSFLGLGDPNAMSWGYVIATGREVLRTDWYITALPGLAVLATVLAINLVGEGLNDALNPRSRNR